jgi:hypothetical protein
MYATVLSGPFLDTEYCFQVSLEIPNNDDCQLWEFIKPNKLKTAVYEIINAECGNNIMLKDVQGHPEKWLVGYSFPNGEDPCRNPVSDAHSRLLCYHVEAVYRSCGRLFCSAMTDTASTTLCTAVIIHKRYTARYQTAKNDDGLSPRAILTTLNNGRSNESETIMCTQLAFQVNVSHSCSR